MIVEINDENVGLVYPFFVNLHVMIPYMFLCTQEELANSLLHEVSEGDQMFAELYTYAIVQGDKVSGLIQYGIPNYEVLYDGERNYDSRIGVIRLLYFNLSCIKEGKDLMKKALRFFMDKKITSLKAFPHEYGMKVFGYHGKLYKSEYFVYWYLRLNHWKVSVRSIYYTKSLKRMQKVSENRGYSFKAEEEIEGIQYFTICKYEKPIGGVQFHYVNNHTVAYMDFIYLSQEYQGRGWGSEAMWQLMLYLREKNIQRIDTDMEEMNAIGQRFLEKCKFGKLGESYSFERSKVV